MERLQTLVPEAHFVKAFNSTGNGLFYKPQLSQQPTMFICGSNDTAKTQVKDILTAFGWETADMGMVESARSIEALCMLWCIPGFRENDWAHAFKYVK